jgi:hypothetical protein
MESIWPWDGSQGLTTGREEGERLRRITSETLVGSFGPQPRTPPPALSSSVGLGSGWRPLDVSQGAP